MASKLWDVMNDLEMVTSKIVSAREIIDSAAEAIQNHDYNKAETLAMAAYEFLGYYLDEFDAKFKLAWQETVIKQKKEEEDAWDAVNKEKEYYEPSMPPWGHSDLEYLAHHKEPVSCDRDDPSPECKGAWNSFWEENYYPEESQQYTEEELNAMCDKAASDEEKNLCKEYNIREQEYIEPFTTDIGSVVRNGVSHIEYVKAKIEATSAWNDGWTKEHYQKIVDKYEGKKEEKTLNYDEAIAAGWTMSDDGFWMPPQDKWTPPQEKKKWVLPVEQVHDDYFVSFPDDLLEAADLKEGDQMYWYDNKDGSYTLRKMTETPKPLKMDEC